MFHPIRSINDSSSTKASSSASLGSIRLFSADLDGTLLGVPEATERFANAWHALPRAERPFLLYNTGRCVRDVQCLVSIGALPEPDGIVGSVGTELWLREDGGRVDAFQARFSRGWNAREIERIVSEAPGIVRQPASAFTWHKLSWFWDDATESQLSWLRTRLAEAGLQVKLVYSARRYLDIVPAAGDKGQALAWLCEQLNVPLTEVLVAGDTGNDSSMLLLSEVRRLVVGNALPELLADLVGMEKYCSRGLAADGVLDGLRAYGVLRARSGPRTRAVAAEASC